MDKITLTLHQKLKFTSDDIMIVIGGKEDILVSHMTSFRYIDVDGETIETPFLYLEVVSVLTVNQTQEHSKFEPSMASWKGSNPLRKLVMSKVGASW